MRRFDNGEWIAGIGPGDRFLSLVPLPVSVNGLAIPINSLRFPCQSVGQCRITRLGVHTVEPDLSSSDSLTDIHNRYVINWHFLINMTGLICDLSAFNVIIALAIELL